MQKKTGCNQSDGKSKKMLYGKHRILDFVIPYQELIGIEGEGCN